MPYQPDDGTEVVKDLLDEMTNSVVCEVDHSKSRSSSRKCKPGVVCTLFKKIYRPSRPTTPITQLARKCRQRVTRGVKGRKIHGGAEETKVKKVTRCGRQGERVEHCH